MSAPRLGAAVIDRVEEHCLPVPLALLTSDEAFIARRVAPLPGGFLDPESKTFQFSNHSWVLRVDDLTILVDPCTGNGRKGRGPYFDDLDTPCGYFTGDVFHHPVQVTRPELHLPGCDDLQAAIATRKEIVQRVLDEEAFIFPAHFSAPHHGQLAIDGDEVGFVPGGADEVGAPAPE
jgi:hypothetical protein